MITLSDLQKYDHSEMYKIYDNWPQTAIESFEKKDQVLDFKNIDQLIFSGMGGSGTICDVFSSIFSQTSITINVTKGYNLPKPVNENTLVVVISASGNTQETITVLKSAHKKGLKIVAFSDDGKIQDYCSKNNIVHKKITLTHSPRSSFPSFLYSILNFFEPILPLTSNEIKESITALEKKQYLVSSDNIDKNNPSLMLADWITGIPMIYYPWGLNAAAIRFKNSLQENAKSHAMVENVIEACHNNIVAWEKTVNVKPILIKGQDDYFKTKQRWEILQKFFDIQNIDYWEINSIDGNILSKLVDLIYLLDYASIYRAVLSKIDPSTIYPIDFIKNEIASY